MAAPTILTATTLPQPRKTLMVYKIDIYHRDKNLTFGPRFKGEVGKDIFAAKVALGLLVPLPDSNELESGVQISYDANIPMDQQRWFDCSTGVGVDVTKATKFDTTLENALLTYQVNNQFLITAYYFEKFGIEAILNLKVYENTLFEAEVLAQANIAAGLFESELRTLGEATIAIMHGWRPATKLTENSSYTHNQVFTELNTVYDILPYFLYQSLEDDLYPQNFDKLVEQGIAIPDSLQGRPSGSDIAAALEFIESRRNWISQFGESETNFQYGFIQYEPVLSGNSPLYVATTKVIDFYIENNLFSQQLSQEEIVNSAKRALYPDPFVRNDVFIIDGTRLGIYLETDFFLRSSGPLPNSRPETIELLEEKALIRAIRGSDRPTTWYLFREDPAFNAAYFSSTPQNVLPKHSGVFPQKLSRDMIQELNSVYDEYPTPDNPTISVMEYGQEVFLNYTDFAKKNYWVLSTSDVTSELPEGDNSVEYWRTIEGFGNTEPLIKFVEYITPSLRPGQSYRALFEINRQKFESIVHGHKLVEPEPLPGPNTEPTEESVCLDQNSEQTQRTYEEYRAHAIKKRRDLVRIIREEVQKQNNSGARIDLGGFDSTFGGLGIDNYTDYELVQKAANLLPGRDWADFISGYDTDLNFFSENISAGDGTLDNDADDKRNKLVITFGELKERIELATEDLKESAEVINRERIRFEPGSNFDAANEAVNLALIPQGIEDTHKSIKPLDGSVTDLTDETTITIEFERVGTNQLGHTNGKRVTSMLLSSVPGQRQAFLDIEILKRPRTVNYLSQIKDMTGLFKLSRFFDDARGACKDLGIDLDKMTAFAFVTKYTSGLKAIMDEKEEFTFKSWWEQEVEDPIKEYGKRSADNWDKSLDPGNFDKDAALRALGKECTAEKMMKEVFKKLNLTSLLCDYIKCLKLPAFDLKLANFNLPPLPTIEIIGWYDGLIKFIQEEYKSIINRILCTMARMIIDKLAFPFCEEQLEDFIRNDLTTEQPFARAAVIESLTRTGVSDGDKAKNFFDAISNILTGKELCYILQGNRPDDATMLAIERLAAINGVSEELQTPDDIVNFFGVIGVYIPDEFCEQLNNQVTVKPTACDDTNSLLRSIRNRLQSGDGDITEEEINEAVTMAEKNKQEEADRLASLFENGFNGMVPPIFGFGNQDAIVSDIPEQLKIELEKSAGNLFGDAKSSYSQGLAQYVPAMYVSSPVNLWPYDERYDQRQTLRLEAAMQQLQDFANVTSKENPRLDSFIGGDRVFLPDQFLILHSLYETEIIHDIRGDLIPDHIRKDLQPNLRKPGYYLVPHEATVSRYRDRIVIDEGARQVGIEEEKIYPNAVVVHRRHIVPEGGQFSEPTVRQELTQLQREITRYTTRINRINSPGKRSRLRRERGILQDRFDVLEQLLQSQDLARPTPVTYEFYMFYQQNRAHPAFENTDYNFALVPLSKRPTITTANYDSQPIGIELGELEAYLEYFSLIMEFNTMDPIEHGPGNVPEATTEELKEEEGHAFVADSIQMGNYIESSPYNFQSKEDAENENPPTNASDNIQRIKDRVDFLQNKIIEILTNKPPITDELLFPGLQEMLSMETERMLESGLAPDGEEETVSATRDKFQMKFKSGNIYSPSVTLFEHPAAKDKDRYDIVIEGDFYIGLDLASSLGPAGVKEFKYCEQLSDVATEPQPDVSGPIFGKRHRFKNVYFNGLGALVSELSQGDSLDRLTRSVNNLYIDTTESILETLLDSLYDSYLFSANGTVQSRSNLRTKYDSVESLDKRVTGKREINECVSNKFSFGNGSVINFDKTIMGDVSFEIAKEMTKPENAPENYDFDTPSAFDLAMQNLAMKGFIRACLVDFLLKGGLAYSVWDVEPVLGEPFFIDYAITHVREELDSNNRISPLWGRIIERVTGIANKTIALETLVKEEILKLSNYSKQVFHPSEHRQSFYDWYIDSEVPSFHIASISQTESDRFGATPLIASRDNVLDPRLVIPNEERTVNQIRFSPGKPKFIIEHYIEILGTSLVRKVRQIIEQIPGIEYSPQGDRVILSIQDFRTVLDTLVELEEVRGFSILLSSAKINQVARIVHVLPQGPEQDPESQDATGMLRTLQFSGVPISTIRSESLSEKSYRVFVRDQEGDLTSALAVPMLEQKRELDFKDCYSLETYDLPEFAEGIPYIMQELKESEEYNLLLGQIFPVRRFMSMVSVFATSIMSGYNSMPSIMTPTKNSLAFAMSVTGMSRNERAQMKLVSSEEFIKQLTENFPTDESNCIEFPGDFDDIFRKFFEELFRLIRQMPSIIFRGIANTLDPAYKEMRQHYINCDIDNLTYRGLRPAGTVDYKLTNGLYLSGTERVQDTNNLAESIDRSLYGGSNGKYVPLASGFLSDVTYAAGSIPNFRLLAERLGISIAKLVTYIYSGNTPFLDPSFYFKVPCADIDTGAWRNKGKYDAGAFGRYGHPLSPFTLFALATPQLESDKRAKENQCIEIPEEECVPNSGGSLYVPESEVQQLETESLSDYLPRLSNVGVDRWTVDEVNDFMANYEIYQQNIDELLRLNNQWVTMITNSDNYLRQLFYWNVEGSSQAASTQVGGYRFIENDRTLPMWYRFNSVESLYIGDADPENRMGLYYEEFETDHAGDTTSLSTAISFEDIQAQTKYPFDVFSILQDLAANHSNLDLPKTWGNGRYYQGQITIWDTEGMIDPEFHQIFEDIWVRLNDLNSVIAPALVRMGRLYQNNSRDTNIPVEVLQVYNAIFDRIRRATEAGHPILSTERFVSGYVIPG